jgi:Dyp-type peroxidase family
MEIHPYNLGLLFKEFILDFLNEDNNQIEKEPVLETSQIQGNVLLGFNKPYQEFVFFKITDVKRFKLMLRTLIPLITTTDDVIEFRRQFRKTPDLFENLPTSWMNFAITFQGLRKLEVRHENLVDNSFRESFVSRYNSRINNSESSIWKFGGQRNEIDVLFVVANDIQTDLKQKVSDLKKRLMHCTMLVDDLQGNYFKDGNRGKEHFGFKDGISQPSVRGRTSLGDQEDLVRRNSSGNHDLDEEGQDMIWPGEFVFGYPGQSMTNYLYPSDNIDIGEEWGRNGSYLVFLKFYQNDKKFRLFLKTTAELIKSKFPNLSNFSEVQLAEKLMGRNFDGNPISNNDFLLKNPISKHRIEGTSVDQQGLHCPFSAHIRKTYPKNDLNKEKLHKHRILRRGIPFGQYQSKEDNKGLLFLCYQTSIRNQFETLFFDWMKNPNFFAEGVGLDLITGSSNIGGNLTNTFSFPYTDDLGRIQNVTFNIPNDLVRLAWGEYFFTPSVNAISSFAM